MKALYQRWTERLRDPVFAFTADQDWAPEWATGRFLDFLEGADVPVHTFVTNPSPALERAQQDGVTLGAHPNFLSGSTHGSTPEEVINTCRALVPNARTVRSHIHAENSHILQLLTDAGFDTDSNLSLFLQPGIVPLIHSTGILRLPVFLDDDSLLLWDQSGTLDLAPAKRALGTPGLKILNFHPALFAINCPSADYYRTHRDELYSTTAPMRPFDGRGLATLLEEMLEWLRANGHTISPFLELVDECWRDFDALEEGALYGWGSKD